MPTLAPRWRNTRGTAQAILSLTKQRARTSNRSQLCFPNLFNECIEKLGTQSVTVQPPVEAVSSPLSKRTILITISKEASCREETCSVRPATPSFRAPHSALLTPYFLLPKPYFCPVLSLSLFIGVSTATSPASSKDLLRSFKTCLLKRGLRYWILLRPPVKYIR